MSNDNTIENNAITGKKLYYTISEACVMADVKDNTLRAWERDFPQLSPKRGKSGVRLYRERDIELVKYIKHLLFVEKYTTQGARQRITEERRAKRYGLELPPRPAAPIADDDVVDGDVTVDVVNDNARIVNDDARVGRDVVNNNTNVAGNDVARADIKVAAGGVIVSDLFADNNNNIASSQKISAELLSSIRSELTEILRILER